MNKRAGAPPTIIDVARQAGVSIKTVSRVMNKEPTVHADTRARVQEAVAALKVENVVMCGDGKVDLVTGVVVEDDADVRSRTVGAAEKD